MLYGLTPIVQCARRYTFYRASSCRATAITLAASCLFVTNAGGQSAQIGTWELRGYTGASPAVMVDLSLATR
jgi:hypothetical protein